MTLRLVPRRQILLPRHSSLFICCCASPLPKLRCFSTSSPSLGSDDPRLRKLGREISDDYATLRSHYATPKYPIVLAHGLFGFSELALSPFPSVQYWRGIKDALQESGASVYATSVPPSSSIEERAAKLSADIASIFADRDHEKKKNNDQLANHSFSKADETQTEGTTSEHDELAVNIIAHSMGGLDARYMIAHLPPFLPSDRGRTKIKIASLTTIATPHRGSSFATSLLQLPAGSHYRFTPLYLPNLYRMIRRAGLSTAAFSQLTTSYMTSEFNPCVPDSPETRYFSFGSMTHKPPILSPFRLPWSVVDRHEGPNDGLVSVESAKWGEYRGTLVDVSHLDLINWTNRLRWTLREWTGMKRSFNAIALYLDIADMLAKEGL